MRTVGVTDKEFCKKYLNDKFYDNLQKYTEYPSRIQTFNDINFENTTVQKTTLPIDPVKWRCLSSTNLIFIYC